MTEHERIASRCTRVAQMVDAPVRDQTILLRAARMLKLLHGDLTRSAWQQTRQAGRTAAGAEATQALASAERHLRRALLEYGSLAPTELRDLVARALGELVRVRELLETPARATLAEAM
jgi:hypothetical protein